MSNGYGYMTNVPHTIGSDGKTKPVSETNPIHVITSAQVVGTPTTPTGLIELYDRLGLGEVNYDAAGRARVSELHSLGDYKSIGDDMSLFYSSAGTGTETYSSADSSFNLSVGAGEWEVKQTKMYHNYSSGKSQLVEATFSNFEPETDITKRLGYFDSSTVSPHDTDFDGFYLESSGGEVKFVIDKNGTNLVSVPQSSWLDPLDGTGTSGLTIDWSNFNIVAFDFLWLGGSTVRLFFYIEGRLALAHAYIHSNIGNSTFIRSPNKPVRMEIRSSGAGTGSMVYICSTVSTEGSLDSHLGIHHSANNGTTHLDANVVGTKYAIFGMRLKSSRIDTTVEPTDLELLALTNDGYIWEVFLNPTVAGTFTYTGVAESAVEVAWGATANTVSGGTLLASGVEFQQSSTTEDLESALRIGSTIDGTVDELVVAITPISVNLDILGTMTWNELV